MNIALTFNLKPSLIKKNEEDLHIEYDSIETINNLKEAIEANGHKCILIEANEEAYINLKKNREKIDFVFNFAEGIEGRSRESQIPIFCEMLKIPYLGPDPLTSGIILNKARTKEILGYYNIPTPRFQIMKNENENLLLEFPVLVKAIAEGSSKGLNNKNLVNNENELRNVVRRIIKRYKQEAIVEEFLDGEEFTVSIIGNENPIILPIVEIRFHHLPDHLNNFDSYEAKWIYDNPKNNKEADPLICPAEIDRDLEEKIKEVSLKTFRVLDCKDWARIDIRLDKNKIPNVLEVNTPVGLIKDPKENSRMPRAAYTLGWSYEKLVGEILNAGLKRWKIKTKLAIGR